MADYYPLVARAVSGLTNSTGDVRRALYERARSALVTQLRNSDPPLSESDITRERLALEDAIRRVEADAAHRSAGAPANPPADGAPDDPAPAPGGGDADDAAPSAQDGVAGGSGESQEQDREARDAHRDDAIPDRETGAEPAEPDVAAGAPPSPRKDFPTKDFPAKDLHAKGFRDTLGAASALGSETARSARAARETYDALPGSDGIAASTDAHRSPLRPPSPPSETATIGQAPPPPYGEDPDDPYRAPGRFANLFNLALILLAVAILAGAGYWQRANIASLFNSVQQTAPTQTARDASPGPAPGAAKPKIADRIAPGAPSQSPGAAPATDVAQKVVLYEEDTSDPQGKRFLGSATWRTETVSPGPGLAPELAIRADIDVPERRLRVTWSLRRNADKALPASHTIEIMFTVPADFAEGGIANVPGVLMKTAEQTRGTPLAGLAVKVTTGYFLIGLSAVETDVERNLQFLKERPWFDIPIVFNNGKRAILAVEKGPAGERVFEDAMRAWGQGG